MPSKRLPQQGEIWLVQFEPQVGREIMKTRPALVLTNTALNRLPTRIILPLRDYKPFHEQVSYFVPLYPNQNNRLSKTSTIDCSQIKSFDIQRFLKRLGLISSDALDEVIAAVHLCIER